MASIGNDTNYIGSIANYTYGGNYIASINDSFGNSNSYYHDQNKGTLTSATDANGKTTNYGYDSMNRTTSVSKSADGQTITNNYTYENDRISKVTHNGFDYNFKYDGLGNNTQVLVGNSPLITNNYESRTGKLLDYTYGNGQKITNQYDGNNNITGTVYSEDNPQTIIYSGNIQNIGIRTVTGNDAMLGTVAQSLRLESLNITLRNAPAGMKIKYQAHVQDIGWQNWVYEGGTAGTIDQSKRMEAVRIKLEGAPAGYSVQYQVHIEGIGWMNPVQDGELAGIIGESKRIEAIKINVSKLRNIYKFDANGNMGLKQDFVNNTSFKYNYDISNRLTKIEESNGNYTSFGYDNNNNTNNITEKINENSYTTSFSFDKDNRVTSAAYNRGNSSKINYTYDPLFGRLAYKDTDTGIAQFKTTYGYEKGNGTSVGVQYSAYVSSAWQSMAADGNIIGTVGESLPIEGLKMTLRNPISGMNIKYRVYFRGAWSDWIYNGKQAGVIGSNIEAVQIALTGAPAGYHIHYQAQLQDKGWMAPVSDGSTAGTAGLRLEALKVSIVSDAVQYSTYVPSAWQSAVNDGDISGTVGKNLPMQGLKVSLVNPPSGMRIKYQVHVSSVGWMDWVYDGAQAGEIGKDIEAVRISLEGAPSGYHVQYQAHVQNIGWTDPKTDGNLVGTTGKNLNLEALKITIIKPGTDSTRISSINNNGSTINYTYDKNGNIQTITDGGKVIKYYYNELNELKREDNAVLNKTITYDYDAGGNITNKTEYELTSRELGRVTARIPYAYEDTTWKDKLTSFNGKAITYDKIGNPLTYDGNTFTWEMGRQLKGITATGLTTSYKYNDSGIRTEKTVNGVTTKYHLVGDKVTFETNGTDKIYYTYDSSGMLLSMNLNGYEYYYVRNVQGDIIGIHNKSAGIVASYIYDSWGKLISIKDQNGADVTNNTAHVGYKNPYRYRGYRYDTESGLYYLNSRYYNSDWGRFLNVDAYAGQMGALLSFNMFAYCNNNPVNMSDPNGNWPAWLDYIIDVVEDVVNTVIDTVESVVDSVKEVVNNVVSYVDNVVSSAVSMVKASLGASGEPNSVGEEYDKNGNLTKKRWYGPDGRAVKDRHFTDHGNPKQHPKVPHDHDWGYNKSGKWTPGPWYSDIGTKVKVSIGVAGGSYLIYRGIRMIPSLAPPLWWTIPGNIVTP